jgi:pyroglutamyl-peptidase
MMHAIAIDKLPIYAGFMHLPYLHEQIVNKPMDVPSMSRETMTQAVRIAIEVSLQEYSTKIVEQQVSSSRMGHA